MDPLPLYMWADGYLKETEMSMLSAEAAEADEVRRKKRGALPCQTPGCSLRCAYAYSCHNLRTGRARVMVWPAVALGLLALIALLA